MRLAERIAQSVPEPGTAELFYLGQAGFMIKGTSGVVIGLDLYLSDALESADGAYKRLIPTPLTVAEFTADILASTHAHGDHLDVELAADAARRLPGLHLVGAPDCRPVYRKCNIPDERTSILACGKKIRMDGVDFRAVYADHGELAPEAVGLIIDCGGVRIYHTGDTSCCPERLAALPEASGVDVLIVPINPAYGNPGEKGAAEIAAALRPRSVLAAHFGMFVEHGGVPGAFLNEAAGRLPAGVQALVPAPGEKFTIAAGRGVIASETAAAAERRKRYEAI